MGMFDSIFINIKCPFCDEESEMECQTKDLECNLNNFKKGGHIRTDKYDKLECITNCQSKQCIGYTIKKNGYKSGFGRLFYVNLKIDNGIVTGDYEILNLERV